MLYNAHVLPLSSALGSHTVRGTRDSCDSFKSEIKACSNTYLGTHRFAYLVTPVGGYGVDRAVVGRCAVSLVGGIPRLSI